MPRLLKKTRDGQIKWYGIHVGGNFFFVEKYNLLDTLFVPTRNLSWTAWKIV